MSDVIFLAQTIGLFITVIMLGILLAVVNRP
jgi:hypothetical protein